MFLLNYPSAEELLEKYPEYFRELFGNAITDYNSGKEGKATYDKFANSYNTAKSIIDDYKIQYKNK